MESAGLKIRPSLWLGINLQILLNSQVLGEKGRIRSNQVTMDTHAPHIPAPSFFSSGSRVPDLSWSYDKCHC